VRLTIALWVAAIPAYFLGSFGSHRYPTLSESPFFRPLTIGFILLYAIAIVRWLRHRPHPHGPWRSGCLSIGVGRFLLALLVAAPAGFASGYLYEPAFMIANGMFATGNATQEHAMVAETSPRPVLDLLYATPPFRWKVRDQRFIPADLVAGSLATLTVRSGFLGALWVEKVEYEALK
jgi:hypothetical protein